ncbi:MULTISPECIES: phage terminase small subunit [Dickeya]|uniref:Phage terminase, endonuclease subunit n=1 Tax=Dickeya aquatica TaxID=1401087 RepID=A0A375AB61_9GAMM|nr:MULTISPECIES: phage terminase small subunit [Dickeya]SLM62829.1 Phage terminase, endonuclease subunit [Dickeya aquatica]
MLTPAQRHFQSVSARHRGLSDAVHHNTAYEQQLHRLRLDQSRLHEIQSSQSKALMKRELLPNYQGWIDGALAADTGQADEVLVTMMVWSIDVGDISAALRIGEYVIRHGLPMPDRYKRTAATALVDEICDPVLAAFKADAARAPLDVALLLQLNALTAGADMPDMVRAKLYKSIGYTLRLSSHELTAAREWLQRAIALFDGIGVKRDIEILGRAIKKAALADGTDNGDDAGANQSAEPLPDQTPPPEKPVRQSRQPARKTKVNKSTRGKRAV